MNAEFTEADVDYYEIRRHDRMRARLWSEFARTAQAAICRENLNGCPHKSVMEAMSLTIATMADYMMAEYDRRWPRQKEEKEQ